MNYATVDASVSPKGRLDVLSKSEVNKLLDSSQGGLYETLRRCSLAVLNSGGFLDDGKVLLERYPDFAIRVVQNERGIRLELKGAPAIAFVDGQLIRGINDHLFAVLRDIIYVSNEIANNPTLDLRSSVGITDGVFRILRNANILRSKVKPNLTVCWGGHSISREEYDYTKQVGYELGLRGLDICTGCGPGAMKGPMKGAAVGHAKQRIAGGRYLGMTEPGIIAAESPNPIVNDLVILPDIEKRLEAFVRVGHAFVVFPGGAGTAEEILYLLGVLLHSDNEHLPFPLIFTGPASAIEYFRQIDRFVGHTLGDKARERYRIIVDDPAEVARRVRTGIDEIAQFRKLKDDAYYFNWRLRVPFEFQQPFEPTHDSMRLLELRRSDSPDHLASQLRRAFSGIVTGNVKEHGIRAVERDGPFELHGDDSITGPLDELLRGFIAQQRMKLPGSTYVPCYRVVR
jgi:predicted Rossmann-fold nucleotide-binding protein